MRWKPKSVVQRQSNACFTGRNYLGYILDMPDRSIRSVVPWPNGKALLSGGGGSILLVDWQRLWVRVPSGSTGLFDLVGVHRNSPLAFLLTRQDTVIDVRMGDRSF